MSQAQSTERIKRTIEAEAASLNGAGPEVRQPTFDDPAVGLIAHDGESADVAAAILRASRAGLQTLVAYDPAYVDRETLEFAADLGATLIEPGDGGFDEGNPTARLRRAARERGYPGLVMLPDLTTRVDFERTRQRLNVGASYLVEATPRPAAPAPGNVLIGIPAYNEAGSIGSVVEAARPHGTVLVVDDGSDDDTAAVARAAGASVVEHGRNRGYGAALKTLFTEAERAGAAHLVVLDGDGQHEPSDVPRLVETQRSSEAEIVIGSRFAAGAVTDAPAYRLVGLSIVNLLTNLGLGLLRSRSRVRDTQSGFRAYDRRAIESLADEASIGDGMGASTDVLYHAFHNDFAVEEVGTSISYDVEAANSQHPLSHGLDLVDNLLSTVERDRPVLTLGVPGLLCALMGAGLGYWTVWNVVSSGSLSIGLALLSTFFLLAGILASLAGIVLHSLNAHLAGESRHGPDTSRRSGRAVAVPPFDRDGAP